MAKSRRNRNTGKPKTTDAETTDAETTADAETTDAETTDAETTADAETTDAETTDAETTADAETTDDAETADSEAPDVGVQYVDEMSAVEVLERQVRRARDAENFLKAQKRAVVAELDAEIKEAKNNSRALIADHQAMQRKIDEALR